MEGVEGELDKRRDRGASQCGSDGMLRVVLLRRGHSNGSRRCRLLDESGHNVGLVPLGPVRCILNKTQLSSGEEAGEVAGKVGAEVLVAGAKQEGDRQVQSGELSRCDSVVLLVEVSEQGCRPGSNGRECIGTIAVAEELRKDAVGTTAFVSSGSSPNCRAV
jgi:hypothetical protein